MSDTVVLSARPQNLGMIAIMILFWIGVFVGGMQLYRYFTRNNANA